MRIKKDYKVIFLEQIKLNNLPLPDHYAEELGGTGEFRFHRTRKWRFDFCYEKEKIAIEYQGGTFMPKSGHSNVAGQTRDCEKFSKASILGWTLIFINAPMIDSGQAVLWVEAALKIKRGNFRGLDTIRTTDDVKQNNGNTSIWIRLEEETSDSSPETNRRNPEATKPNRLFD